MRKGLGIFARVVWIALCVAVLLHAHRGYQGISDWEMEEWLGWQMMALSFPSSLLVVVGVTMTGAILSLFHLALPPSSKPEMTITWFLFVVAGYAQWFFLLPRLLQWRKRSTDPQ